MSHLGTGSCAAPGTQGLSLNVWTDTSGEQQYLVVMALPSRKSPKQVRIQQTTPIWGTRRPGFQTWFNCSVRQGLPAGPSPPQRHLTFKLCTAELIPLPPKVCHHLREQQQHSLSHPARNRAVIRGVYISCSPPHTSNRSPRPRAATSQQLLVSPLLTLMPLSPPVSLRSCNSCARL